MPFYIYIILASWVLWLAPFLSRRPASGARLTKKQARWGILLEAIAFALLWQGRFWERNPGWKLFPAVALMVIAALLSWTGVVALGRQWRVDAALNADHELIRSGPYSMVRHPIYASLLFMLIGTGLIITPVTLFIPALVIFIIGTEIRVRVEDGLLASNFGAEFTEYKRKVRAYIPWVR